jgi:hypothetical protein
MNSAEIYAMATLIPAAFLVIVMFAAVRNKTAKQASDTNTEIEAGKETREKSGLPITGVAELPQQQVAGVTAENPMRDTGITENPLQLQTIPETFSNRAALTESPPVPDILHYNHLAFARHMKNHVDIICVV